MQPHETRGVGADVHTIVVTIMSAEGLLALNAGTAKALAAARGRLPGLKVRGRHEKP